MGMKHELTPDPMELENLHHFQRNLLFFIYDFTIAGLAIIINTFALIGVKSCKLKLYGYRIFLMSLIAGDLYMV